jgi:hypothetical protein
MDQLKTLVTMPNIHGLLFKDTMKYFALPLSYIYYH